MIQTVQQAATNHFVARALPPTPILTKAILEANTCDASEASVDNPTGMHSKVYIVTPSMAAHLLSLVDAETQRHMAKARIDSYCAQILNGSWKLTHQGGAIDTDGDVRDSCHRLTAIVQADRAVPMNVTFRLDPESAVAIDQGKARTVEEAIKMAGLGDYSKSIVATVKAMAVMPKPSIGRVYRSFDYVYKLLVAHRDALIFLEENMPCTQKIGSRGVRALVGRAFYHENHERLKKWCQVLITGKTDVLKSDDAAIDYRNNLLEKYKGKGGASQEYDRYCTGQAAISFFLDYRQMQLCKKVHTDRFPLPKDKIVVESDDPQVQKHGEFADEY